MIPPDEDHQLHREGSERGDRETAVREAHIPLRALTRRAWEANPAALRHCGLWEEASAQDPRSVRGPVMGWRK
mgnify:CR=1 FL=1